MSLHVTYKTLYMSLNCMEPQETQAYASTLFIATDYQKGMNQPYIAFCPGYIKDPSQQLVPSVQGNKELDCTHCQEWTGI